VVALIRVVIADDHPTARKTIRQIINRSDDIYVVGEAVTGLETLHLVQESQPDLVILDISMPELDGLEVAERLRAVHSPVKILILSAYASKDFAHLVSELDIDGYLLKEDAFSNLGEVIHRIVAGERGIFSQKIGANNET